HKEVPFRLLEADKKLSHGDPASGNLIVEGDNLHALKALLPRYAGKVKCICIDPPYNTKSAFEHYDDNLEHAQWLSMMLPRLQLLRELLREDGSIWVTIDDNEGHYLKVLMDEVFGRGNFVANLAWHKRVSPANDAHYFSNDHDHVLVYARAKIGWIPNKLPRTDAQRKYYTNPDSDPRGPWNSAAYTCAKTADERPNLYYPLIHPITGEEVWPKRTRVWAFGRETHDEHIRNKMIYWGVGGGASLPRIKKFLDVSGDVVPRSVWSYDESGHNQEAMLEGLALFGETRFGTPKPERLIQRVLHIATHPNDLILDSFLGSGTTAAVAHKMGRRWIGIEMGEHAATHCLPRLQMVLDGEQGGISKAVGWRGGGGFRFMRLGETVFDEQGCIHPAVRFATLAAFVWQQETGTAFDPARATPGTPHLGTQLGTVDAASKGVAYYLLFNGILGDKRPASGNVLTREVLAALLVLHATVAVPGTPLVVYGESVRVGAARLAAAGATFKQIPYDVRAR
ncbi:MAG: site-specific DNA-methyltransferase, partial [Betaproteobacteria bacterium]